MSNHLVYGTVTYINRSGYGFISPHNPDLLEEVYFHFQNFCTPIEDPKKSKKIKLQRTPLRSHPNLRRPQQGDHIALMVRQTRQGPKASIWTYAADLRALKERLQPFYRIISQSTTTGSEPMVRWEGRNLADKYLNRHIWPRGHSPSTPAKAYWWEVRIGDVFLPCRDPRDIPAGPNQPEEK